MKILVGLGNPGKEYEKTRHNAGARFLEMLRVNWEFPSWQYEKKFKADTSKGTFNGEKIILAFPLTFMNNSGEAVAPLFNFYNIPHQDLWLIYDDLDLPLGTFRFRPSGSSGTHNGMKSVIEKLGTSDFPRLRIGIESRGVKLPAGTVGAPAQQNTTSFVLEKFTKDELPLFENALKKAYLELQKLLK